MSNINNRVDKLCSTDPEFEQKTQLLEKHFHDRTQQPLSKFNKVGEKKQAAAQDFKQSINMVKAIKRLS